MEYIIIGICLSAGWHIVKLIYEVITGVLFSRLNKSKWYQTAAGEVSINVEERPGDIKTVKNQIGFR